MKHFGPIVLLMLVACWPGRAAACSCIPPRPVEQEAADALWVFAGDVAAITPVDAAMPWWRRVLVRIGVLERPDRTEPGDHDVVFRVLEPFKGVRGDRVTVRTSEAGGMCGYPFETGRRYVVYAHAAPGRIARAGICSRTGPASDPATGIRWLRTHRGRLR